MNVQEKYLYFVMCSYKAFLFHLFQLHTSQTRGKHVKAAVEIRAGTWLVNQERNKWHLFCYLLKQKCQLLNGSNLFFTKEWAIYYSMYIESNMYAGQKCWECSYISYTKGLVGKIVCLHPVFIVLWQLSFKCASFFECSWFKVTFLW